MKKNHIYFLRWGNLNPVKHKEARGAADDEWIHIAPCYKGVYAFPRGYVEPFLLGGSYGQLRAHLLKIDGQPITEKDFFNETYENVRPEYVKVLKKKNINKRELTHIEKDGDFYMAYMDKPKHFKYEGDIWHHLGGYLDKKEIMDFRHGWYKTSYASYLKALHKCDVSERFKTYMDIPKGKRHGNPHTHPSYFSKDYYEVFIEKIK